MAATNKSIAYKGKKKTAPKKLQKKLHVKKGDTVMILSGRDKGKTGVIKNILTSKGKALVEGINMVKKAVRPNPMVGQRGGIVDMESPIYLSKLMVYDLKNNQPSRTKRATISETDGKTRRVRVFKKSGEHVD